MRLVELQLGDSPAAWRDAGFTVEVDDSFCVGGIRLVCTGEGEGVTGWTLQVDDVAGRPGTVDGLPTRWVDAAEPTPTVAPTTHPNGATAVDHVVVGSPNRDRTIPVFVQELGLGLRRQTEHRLYGQEMVQSFFLLTPTLIEMISRPVAEGDGPSVFWGLAFVADDLDATKAILGPALTDPKVAVQPGRRIASLHRDHTAVTVPVAFLTPRA